MKPWEDLKINPPILESNAFRVQVIKALRWIHFLDPPKEARECNEPHHSLLGTFLDGNVIQLSQSSRRIWRLCTARASKNP